MKTGLTPVKLLSLRFNNGPTDGSSAGGPYCSLGPLGSSQVIVRNGSAGDCPGIPIKRKARSPRAKR